MKSIEGITGPAQPLPPVGSSLLQLWADVLEKMPDAVIVVGANAGGRILYMNSQATRMFGYERSEVIDQSVEMLVPEQARERHIHHRRVSEKESFRRSMGTGRALFGRRRDGTEFPVEVELNNYNDKTTSATMAVVRDMTGRRDLEDALTQARDSAIRANEVKSRFLAAASHDLRQPLQTIWNLQSVLARALKDTLYAPHLALLEEAVRDMDQMLASLVDINRLEAGAIVPVVRDFSLREILSRLRSAFGYSATSKFLTLEIEESSEIARSDPMLLPVILRNLVGNAIKYTQRGKVRLRVRSDSSQLYIDVLDTGPGISSEHLGRLFEAFYQADNPNRDQRQGVGLGLSIVRTISRLLNHTVTISSRVGEGSVFTVQLPRGAVTNLRADDSPVVESGPALPIGAPKVLHIEDDPGVARSMALLLRLEGYDVISAATRDEALQHVEVHGLRPDIILTDYQLPMGFTGDEVVSEIAARLKSKPPTIMLTGDTAHDHVDKAKAVADRILPKPVNVDVLLREMVKLLNTAT